MPAKRRARDVSLPTLLQDLWSRADRQSKPRQPRQPREEEQLWRQLVALIPALEVGGPSNVPPDVELVQEAITMTATQRQERLGHIVRRLRDAAALRPGYRAAPWRALEVQLGLPGPDLNSAGPTRRQHRIAALRARADAVLQAMHDQGIADADAATELSALVRECTQLRAGGAWLRFHLAGLLKRCGELEEAYRHAITARDSDPLNLHYHLLCRSIEAALTARDAGFTSGERGRA
jgi:hypothetical protein